jgi:CheY-like chemotaxis protein
MAACREAILLIEDSADDATALERELLRAGIRNPVEVARTVPEAIAYLVYVAGRKRQSTEIPPVRVVLLELKLPGLDGFHFLEWLRMNPESGKILVVVVSGLEDVAAIRRAYALGANTFLSKPCTSADLLNLVQRFPGYWHYYISPGEGPPTGEINVR